jgi:hypothetical protein
MKLGETISYRLDGMDSWKDAEIVHMDATVGHSISARDIDDNQLLFLSPEEVQ